MGFAFALCSNADSERAPAITPLWACWSLVLDVVVPILASDALREANVGEHEPRALFKKLLLGLHHTAEG